MRCEEKKSYDYYLDAGQVVWHLKNKGVRRHIYLCNECNKFHLTSQTPKPNRKKEFNKGDYKKLGIYERPKIKAEQ